MKRLFGTWTLEKPASDQSKPETGELIIDGNDIEFYRQGDGDLFHSIFICNSKDFHYYKVIAQECDNSGTRKTLDHARNYRVNYVLQQNCAFRPGLLVDNIVDCSFVIPELIGWLGVKLTEMLCANEHELLVKERIFQPVCLKDADPHIEIVFESGTYNRSIEEGNRTTAVVNVQPRIQITYGRSVTINEIRYWIYNAILGVDDRLRLCSSGHTTYYQWARLKMLAISESRLLVQSSVNEYRRPSKDKPEENRERYSAIFFNMVFFLLQRKI